MGNKETRRHVLERPFHVAKAMVPLGVLSACGEAGVEMISFVDTPISFRYPPGWEKINGQLKMFKVFGNVFKEGVFTQVTLANGVKLVVAISPLKRDNLTTNDTPESKMNEHLFLYQEDLSNLVKKEEFNKSYIVKKKISGGIKGNIVVMPISSDDMNIADFLFVQGDAIYSVLLTYFVMDGEPGENYVGMYLKQNPGQKAEVDQLRDKMFATFQKVLDTIQIKKSSKK